MLNLNISILFMSVIIIRNFKLINAVRKEIKTRDLPLKSDLMNYLKVVEKMSEYSFENTEEIDIHLSFGIFLTNVNIIRSLKDKEDKLPSTITAKLKDILVKNEDSLQIFKDRSTNDTSFLIREFKQIVKLFSNTSYWVDRLKDFVYKEEKSYSKTELELLYYGWDEYQRHFEQVELWVPRPEFSDMCLVSLALNPANKKSSLSWCPVKGSCYSMLKKGSNFGYALTHRLILILMAHLGRGCFIFSEREDKKMIEYYCSMSYAEAEFIELHNYGKADLLLEIILLCSLDGHSQFFRRKWLQKLLKLQLPQGCYQNQNGFGSKSQILYVGSLRRDKNVQRSETCNSHTTAVAIGAYSSAIRLIVQEYY